MSAKHVLKVTIALYKLLIQLLALMVLIANKGQSIIQLVLGVIIVTKIRLI